MTSTIYAPISIGELVDKITILEIKLTKTRDNEKLLNIQREFELLSSILYELEIDEEVEELRRELLKINYELWHIEDAKRAHEQQQLFDSEFIELARNVYLKNDLRAKVKKQINVLTKSGIIEEKIY